MRLAISGSLDLRCLAMTLQPANFYQGDGDDEVDGGSQNFWQNGPFRATTARLSQFASATQAR